MSVAGSAELRTWPGRRWVTLTALVFAFQLGLIFWLSDRKPLPPRAAAPFPVLRLAGKTSAEWLALSDPTLFALPHRRGFSGLAWMGLPPRDFPPFSWTNPPEWLRLTNEQPGIAFYEFIHTNDFGSPRPPASPEVELTLADAVPLPLSRERSALRVEGDLVHRKLLTAFELKSQPAAGLLTNSVVQVVVDAEGRPQTATLLRSSGSAEADEALKRASAKADQEALRQAAVARFAPLPSAGSAQLASPLAASTRGLLVFEWHTVPTPSTNVTASGP